MKKATLLVFLLISVTTGQLSAEPHLRRWTVRGRVREAIVDLPDDSDAKLFPIVLVFHGHGGSMRNAQRQYRIRDHWPQAGAVYLQGLKTPGQLTDPEGNKTGWQKSAGDQEDRDLKFVDAVLASLRDECEVDDSRIYSTGHSNGGGFTFLLWAERGDQFAAFAPSGSAGLRLRHQLKPRPYFHIAGRNDPLVKFSWQQMMIAHVRQLNECNGPQQISDRITRYPSAGGNPVETWISTGGHQFPADAVVPMVKFLEEHSLQQLPEDKGAEAAVPKLPQGSAEQSGAVRRRVRDVLRGRRDDAQ